MDDHEKLIQQLYYSGDREWPGFKPDKDGNADVQVLIGEMQRFVPYLGEDYVEFHPLNMPEVKIRKIEIIGAVMHVRLTSKYVNYIVDDGTGAVAVLYKNSLKKRDELIREEVDYRHKKKAEYAAVNKAWLKMKTNQQVSAHCTLIVPPFEYPPEMPDFYKDRLKQEWWESTKHGMLGKKIKPFDFVHIIGHCAMDFGQEKGISEITDETLELGRLCVFARGMRAISETDYNKMMLTLIHEVACKRYEGLDDETLSSQKE